MRQNHFMAFDPKQHRTLGIVGWSLTVRIPKIQPLLRPSSWRHICVLAQLSCMDAGAPFSHWCFISIRVWTSPSVSCDRRMCASTLRMGFHHYWNCHHNNKNWCRWLVILFCFSWHVCVEINEKTICLFWCGSMQSPHGGANVWEYLWQSWQLLQQQFFTYFTGEKWNLWWF